jgi:hypothetical protein
MFQPRAEAAFDVEDFVTDAGDDRLLVNFGMHPKKDDDKTIEAGRPVFVDVPYVMIRVPGQKNTIIHRPVVDRDKKRFPRQWQRFQAGESEQVEGTPLREWPGCTRGQAETLHYMGVRTVEQLASLADVHLDKAGGSPMLSLREKAKIYLENSKGNAGAERMQEELRERDNRLASLEAQNAQLMRRMDELLAANKPAPQPTPPADPKRK